MKSPASSCGRLGRGINREDVMTNIVKKFLIQQTESVQKAMRQISESGEKQLFVVDAKGRLKGALSDGDIRRWILKKGSLNTPIGKIYNPKPVFVKEGYVLDAVRQTLLDFKIEVIPVVSEEGLVSEILTWEEVFAGEVKKHREKLDVPVVIMAGGKGTRLDPFTRILPKPLIPLGDKPVIEVIMDKFADSGIKDFYVCLQHKARMIKSYFEEANGGYRIKYIEEDQPLGTVGSLRMLAHKIKEPFIVTNCDVLINVDYSELLRFHQESDFDLTLVVSYHRYVIPYGVCRIRHGGILKDIREKPEYDLLVNTGLYVMNKKIVGLIPKNKAFNFHELVAKAKQRGLRIGAFPIPEKAWIDVGQWERYREAVSGFGEKV